MCYDLQFYIAMVPYCVIPIRASASLLALFVCKYWVSHTVFSSRVGIYLNAVSLPHAITTVLGHVLGQSRGSYRAYRVMEPPALLDAV